MKIIQNHHCKSLLNKSLRKLRLFIYPAVLIAASLFIYGLTDIIRNDGSFVLCVIFGIILIVEIFILTSVKKSRRDLLLKQDQSKYRFDEIEFGDDFVSGREYNYYVSSFHSVKYQSVKKICFSKEDVYIYFLNMLVIAFSRADMTETEETALIELLKRKLPADKFSAAKIPQRDTARCREIQLIPEREVVNVFPETAVSYKASSADIRFALSHNYINGKGSDINLRALLWGIIALLSAGAWITGFIIANDLLSVISSLIFISALLVLSAQTLYLIAIKSSVKSFEKMASNEIAVTDYFIAYRNLYNDGTIMSSAYNLAAFLGIAEFRDYFLFAASTGNIAVPKAVLYNHDTLRQIFIKELGPKFRSFPDK